MLTGLPGAFLLTLLAGLSTGLGGLVVARGRSSPRLLASGLGLSAGVMVYVSFMELLAGGAEQLHRHGGMWTALACFFGGIALIMLIDRLVPDSMNPHEPVGLHHDQGSDGDRGRRLMRAGTMTALALTIHNLPEGFATLVTGLDDFRAGLPIAVAIAIHNIPEGIAVAVPIHAATGSRRKAMLYALGSGMAEPIGAGLLFLALAPFISPALVGGCLCAVAGVMVFISLDELLPTAEAVGEHHAAAYGLVAGMAVMAVSLQLLG
ncbi:zinc transporter ZupT [Luteococcus peritonei]|uniref:Zinc transporter ZupT n=1 Tax=Luteococcus peritonei TaxID=88874 RepID=A0ABW4RUQ3_9ACTN